MDEEKKQEETQSGKKAWLLDQKDVDYTTISTVSGQACGGCRWFNDYADASWRCQIVQSYPLPIRETGWCDQFQAIPEPEPDFNDVMEEIAEALGGKEHKPTLLARVKEALKELVLGRKEDPASDQQPLVGFKTIGENRWVACWSNNFKDREGEIFSEKATDAFIARVDNGFVPYPKLRYWHIPRPIGQADMLARIDHMSVATGTFYDDPTSQAMKQSLKEGGILPVSHGYEYPAAALQDGVYHYYDTFEISPLPRNKEANSFTSFKEDKGMNDEKRRDLVARLGKEIAEKYIAEVEAHSKEIEGTGRDYKELTVTDPEARKEIGEVKAAVTELASSIKELVGEIKAAKKPGDDKDKDDAMDDIYGKKKKELDDAIAAAQKATADLEAKRKDFESLTPRRGSRAAETKLDKENADDQKLIEDIKQKRGGEKASDEDTLFEGAFGPIMTAAGG